VITLVVDIFTDFRRTWGSFISQQACVSIQVNFSFIHFY